MSVDDLEGVRQSLIGAEPDLEEQLGPTITASIAAQHDWLVCIEYFIIPV